MNSKRRRRNRRPGSNAIESAIWRSKSERRKPNNSTNPTLKAFQPGTGSSSRQARGWEGGLAPAVLSRLSHSRVRLSALCVLLIAFCCFLLLPPAPASSQAAETQPTPSPSPSPSTSPSPSPTPITGLHQWGAVTLFHGLPSDRVRAIAQGPDGAMWFGTEAGLAKFDGRRTQTVTIPDLSPKILALQSDQWGGLWVGTETGAARLFEGHFEVISEIAGNSITSIVTPEAGRVLLTTERGNIFECRLETNGQRHTAPLLNQPLESADREHPGPLAFTSVALLNNQVMAGSMSRGLLTIIDGMARERESGPAAFFVRALAVDEGGKLWVGTRVRKGEPGLLTGRSAADLVRNENPTGTITTIHSVGHDVWVATDGNGVLHFSDDKKVQRLTFDGTGGGLRSDHVYAIFQDREEDVWFGTDRGVCRYDPNAPRVEQVGGNPQSNFVRVLYQTSDGYLLCGTNQGLFVYDKTAAV